MFGSNLGSIEAITVWERTFLKYQVVTATWRSGYAAVCKTVYPGSIPGVASTFKIFPFNFHYLLPVLSNRVSRLDNFCSPSVRSWMSSA